MSWRWAAGLIGLVMVYYTADGFASAYTLSDVVARPVLALERGGERVAVAPLTPRPSPNLETPTEPSAKAEAEGMARPAGGRGVPFGYASDFVLPDGTRVTCTHILGSMWCGDGWQAVRGRAAAPSPD